MSPALRANLEWLGKHDPGLRTRLMEAPQPGALAVEAGELVWHRGLQATRIREDPADLDALVPGARAGDVVWLGVGSGVLLRALLERVDGTVVAWDRDVAFLRPALDAVDWTPWLSSGKLRFASGSDLLAAPGTRLAHPQLGVAYPDELAFQGDRPRALLVSGTLFVDDVGEALREEGWDVFRWDVRDLPVNELERIARGVAPSVVVGINHTYGLAEACAKLGVPLVEWEIDPSTDTLAPTHVTGATVWTWRRDNVPAYRKAGFQAHYLPLATNPVRRAPVELTAEDRATYGVPVAYVGSSMVGRGRELLAEFVRTFGKIFGDADAGLDIARQLLDVQAKRVWDEGYILPRLLRRLAPDLDARFAAAGSRHRPDALLGELAAARYRLEVLAAVANQGLHVWGDPGWDALAPAGATIRGWAGHYHELTRIYSAAHVHVDVGRLYQLDIVPMRIFDVIAAGGFVLAQHSDALADVLVPGVEVETWRTREELRQKVAFYLSDPDARARIVHAGRARVLAEHTIRRRVRTMLAEANRGMDAA